MFRIHMHADEFSNLASPAQFPQNLRKSLQSQSPNQVHVHDSTLQTETHYSLDHQ